MLVLIGTVEVCGRFTEGGGFWTSGDSGLMNKPEITEKIPEQFRFSPYIPYRTYLLMSDICDLYIFDLVDELSGRGIAYWTTSETRHSLTVAMAGLIVFCLCFLAGAAAFQPVPQLRYRQSISMVSTQGQGNKISDDFRSVLDDVVKVITTTGARPGITRSLQVAGAVSKLLREFSRSQTSFQDSTGRLAPPKILKRLFEELGATYIKLGQFIASSPTLFPAEYVLEFQSCLDNTPTVSYSVIRKIIQDDLKKPLSEIYSYVDPSPLASASVAQVHRARLKDGTEVVIKVRKPGVDSTLEADLGFLFISSRLLELLNPSLSRLSFSSIVGDLRLSMLDELDFRKEAQNLISFRNFLDRNAITDATAPEPYLEASSTRVLTMEYLKGLPLVDLEGIKKYTSNPEATLIAALTTWGSSVVGNEAFHADVHGGNLLVLEDGRVGFIDFGIGELELE